METLQTCIIFQCCSPISGFLKQHFYLEIKKKRRMFQQGLRSTSAPLELTGCRTPSEWNAALVTGPPPVSLGVDPHRISNFIPGADIVHEVTAVHQQGFVKYPLKYSFHCKNSICTPTRVPA